ncbi:MAG: ATP-binding cassette domain-containing protein, partial [bacterium]
MPVESTQSKLTVNTPMPPERLLDVKELKKYFPIRKGFFKSVVGQVRSVDGVTFHLNQGETLGLVGESGCGKTTTSRCLLRAINPTSGEIRYR